MKKIFLLFIVIAVFTACKNTQKNTNAHQTDEIEKVVEAMEVRIKIKNTSDYDYQNIRVKTPTDDLSYGDLPAGEVSDYQSFETAYRYAAISLDIDGKIYRFKPIDYVSETPLSSGEYTYEIDLENLNANHLELKLVAD